MKIIPLSIPDVMLIESRIFEDERGFFFESFNQQQFENLTGIKTSFVQDNHSKSVHGVLRGLHYQKSPKAQGKLVRVTQGEIFDVAVDIRKDSLTFGQWVGEVLSCENKKQIWIPEGFAHGFVTLSDTAEVLYKTTEYYAPECDVSLAWNDADIGIVWPIKDPVLSSKDMQAKSLAQIGSFV
jgi:dTDP-4-dehydrorhamnose 3,5-epimerase